MIYIVIWFTISLIIGFIGSDRKIGFFLSFLASLIFSPFIGSVLVVISKSLVDVKRDSLMLTLQKEQNEYLKLLVKEKGLILADQGLKEPKKHSNKFLDKLSKKS